MSRGINIYRRKLNQKNTVYEKKISFLYINIEFDVRNSNLTFINSSTRCWLCFYLFPIFVADKKIIFNFISEIF